MADLVPADRIEQIVGATRHQTEHIGRAVSAEEMVYILHSRECRDSTPDLRDCPFSRAMDQGVGRDLITQADRPLVLAIQHGRLVTQDGAR